MNTEDYVNYSQAIELKKLGFREKTNHYYTSGDDELNEYLYNNYNNDVSLFDLISAPSLSQAQKWLRINKNVIIYPFCFEDWEKNQTVNSWTYNLIVDEVDKSGGISGRTFDTPEEALSGGISKYLGV